MHTDKRTKPCSCWASWLACIQILIAVFKLGDLTRYISESVVIGFMAGAGTLVAVTQIGNLTGMQDRGTGLQHVLYRTWMTLRDGHMNPRALAIGLSTIVLAVALRYLVRKYRLPQFDMLVYSADRRWCCRVVWLVEARNRRQDNYYDGREHPAQFAHAASSANTILVDQTNVGQRSGHRVPRTPRSAGHCEIHREHHATEARLQPPMYGGRLGQLNRRIFPVLAGVGIVNAFGNQFPGRRGEPHVGHISRLGRSR